MKITIYILSITQAISLTWIVQEARLNSRVPLSFPKLSAPVLNTAPEAELLPDIQSFEDELNGAPRAELFPEVAEVKPNKRKR